jgi:hypothetical protein
MLPEDVSTTKIFQEGKLMINRISLHFEIDSLFTLNWKVDTSLDTLSEHNGEAVTARHGSNASRDRLTLPTVATSNPKSSLRPEYLIL